jgi:hypothetical protein
MQQSGRRTAKARTRLHPLTQPRRPRERTACCLRSRHGCSKARGSAAFRIFIPRLLHIRQEMVSNLITGRKEQDLIDKRDTRQISKLPQGSWTPPETPS